MWRFTQKSELLFSCVVCYAAKDYEDKIRPRHRSTTVRETPAFRTMVTRFIKHKRNAEKTKKLFLNEAVKTKVNTSKQNLTK